MQNTSDQGRAERATETQLSWLVRKAGHTGISCYLTAMVTETQDPNNETRYTSSIWMFVQSSSDKQVQHGLLLLVFKTKSTINIKTCGGPHSQGLTKSQSWFQVPSET